MLQILFISGILLWLTLAVAVGFHANGHDRNPIVWFLIVGIFGIFGLAFYLLAITSAGSDGAGKGTPLDYVKVDNIIAGSIWGVVAGLIISGMLIFLFGELNAIGDVAIVPILTLFLFVGGAIGPYLYSD